MRRITVSLPDEVADVLTDEARRLHRTVSDIVREAVTRQLELDEAPGSRRALPFANLGASGYKDTSVRVDEILAEAWSNDYDSNR